MKTTMKRIGVLLMAAAMTLPMAACSHGTNNGNSSTAENSQENGTTVSTKDRSEDAAALESAIKVGEDGMIDAGLIFIEDPDEAVGDNPIIGDDKAPIVTTIRGEDGKDYVAKTDINGTTVTQAGGEVVTEVYTGTTLATSYAEPAYTPAPKSYLSMWIDTSRQADFVFNGEFLVFDVTVNEDAKDGVYPVSIYHTDFSNYDAQTLQNITTNVGYICVNSDMPSVENNVSGMTLTPDTVQVKPGDKIQYAIKIENNPGIVGFVLKFSYDSNAITINKGKNGADFDVDSSITNRDVSEAQ